jgi:FKBP-type peptidyl-prolyl cis-trans isomerase
MGPSVNQGDGSSAYQEIPANSTLVFEVTLLSIT